ncbi:hypothetical protein [Xenorhabdus sp. TH1]|uniref:hypothetical protein n=1 Tax=Xenorhabdus sp. TH1 TaxID=3130166 RepID=UPI0030CDA611
MITDGEPDNESVAKVAYDTAKSQGIEVITIIFKHPSILQQVIEYKATIYSSNNIIITDFTQIEETIINYCEKYINNALD